MSVETKKPIEVTDESNSSNEPRVDKILSRTRPSRAEVKKMYISLIFAGGGCSRAYRKYQTVNYGRCKI